MTPSRVRQAWLTAARFAVALTVFAAAAALDRGQLPAPVAAAATVVVAVTLWLLRDPLQHLADWFGYGRRPGGYQTVTALLRQMAGTVPVEQVVPRLAEIAAVTAGGAQSEVRVWLADGGHWSHSWPQPAAAPGPGLTVGVRHAGDPIGQIQVDLDPDQITPTSRRLLAELARPAGLALSTVRLTHELSCRAAALADLTTALQTSGHRILAARRDQQTLLQAEIDTHVIPPIDAAAALLQPAAAPGRADPPPELAAAAVHTETALNALRHIARGIFPPRLAEAGLAVSLDGWLHRTGRRASVDVTGEVDRLRTDPQVEACLYFCLVTALAALQPGDRLAVHAHVDSAAVTFRVEAPGSLDPATLLAVRDRVDAFDGTLHDQPGCPVAGQVPLGPPP